MIANAERSRQVLDEEKDPEVIWKLSFISLVAGGMKLKAAIAHFGIGIARAINGFAAGTMKV